VVPGFRDSGNSFFVYVFASRLLGFALRLGELSEKEALCVCVLGASGRDTFYRSLHLAREADEVCSRSHPALVLVSASQSPGSEIDMSQSDREQTLLEREKRIKEQLLLAKRTAVSAQGYGKDTLERLAEQEEVLHSVEDTMEANEHMLNKSTTLLRGMTWSGYLYNKCADAKNTIAGNPLPPPISQGQGHTGMPPSSGSYAAGAGGHRANLGLLTAGASAGQGAVVGDEDLREISSAVDTLHRMGVEIGNQLEQQRAVVDAVEAKAEAVTDKTLALTLRASQLSDRSRQRKPQYCGLYQFVDVDSGHYLSAHEGHLVLLPKISRSTYFNLFVKESHLYALQNEKTQKYLGCSITGGILAASQYFGTQEEVYVDLSPSSGSSGLLFLARHWGAGGWLRGPGATQNTAMNTIDTQPYLTETTSTLLDRVDMLRLRPVKIAQDQVICTD
jgi:hypothetical protein